MEDIRKLQDTMGERGSLGGSEVRKCFPKAARHLRMERMGHVEEGKEGGGNMWQGQLTGSQERGGYQRGRRRMVTAVHDGTQSTALEQYGASPGLSGEDRS